MIDIDLLTNSRPEMRTAKVKAPELKGWPGISDGKIPEFTVRQLTLAEFDQVREAPQQEKLAKALMEKLSTVAGTAEAIAEATVGDQETPESTKRKMRMIVLGAQDPEIDQRAVGWLMQYHPMVAERLFLQISELTGAGAALPGKSLRSGKSRKSGQQSVSAH